MKLPCAYRGNEEPDRRHALLLAVYRMLASIPRRSPDQATGHLRRTALSVAATVARALECPSEEQAERLFGLARVALDKCCCCAVILQSRPTPPELFDSLLHVSNLLKLPHTPSATERSRREAA